MKLNKFSKILSILLISIFLFSSCTSSTTNNSSSNINTKKDTTSANSENLKIHYIDVGQGDSILVEGANKNLLIDAGPRVSTDKLMTYLKKQKIKKLDYVIATHPHEDHIGGMSSVIKQYNIGTFYAPKVTTNTATFRHMVGELKKKNLKITSAKAGISFNLGNNTKCDIIAPNSDKYDNLNNYSVVLKITDGKTKFLFTGDAEKISENEILKKGYNIESDVLKLGHHGSSTSSTKPFLKKVSPKIAIISCGKNNSYHHPHKETVKKLKEMNIQSYRTDLEGNIVISSNGSSYNVKTSK